MRRNYKIDLFRIHYLKNFKFGEFNIECDNDSYTISQTSYINDKLNNQKEMIEISQLLNSYYKDKI